MVAQSYHNTSVILKASSLGLVSLDAAKDELGIDPDDTSKDGQIGRQIAQVSASINTYCGRIFVRQTYRDRFFYVTNWLRRGQPLVMRQAPIATDETGLPLLTVAEAGAAIDATAYEVNCDTASVYRLDSSSGMIAWTASAIIIEYQAGYDSIPEDIQGAALSLLTARWGSRGRDPMLRSQIIPDVVSETYWVDPSATASSMPADVRGTLDSYRLWAV